jgi:hypothetical protein
MEHAASLAVPIEHFDTEHPSAKGERPLLK